MGLARDLTMGPRRPRKARVGHTADYAALRRLTASPAPDLAVFRAVMGRVGRQPGRLRFAELAVYTAASERFHELTGEWIGPSLGTLPEPGEES
jgi:hypothetical protein